MALTKPSHSQDAVHDPAQNDPHHTASAGYANKPVKGSTHTALKGLLNFGIDKPSPMKGGQEGLREGKFDEPFPMRLAWGAPFPDDHFEFEEETRHTSSRCGEVMIATMADTALLVQRDPSTKALDAELMLESPVVEPLREEQNGAGVVSMPGKSSSPISKKGVSPGKSPTTKSAAPVAKRAASPARTSAKAAANKSSTTSVASKRAASPASKGAASPAGKSAASPNSKQAKNATSKRAASPDSKRAASPDSKSATSASSKRAASPDSKRAASPDRKSAVSASSKRATSPTSKSGTAPAGKRAASPNSKNGKGGKSLGKGGKGETPSKDLGDGKGGQGEIPSKNLGSGQESSAPKAKASPKKLSKKAEKTRRAVSAWKKFVEEALRIDHEDAQDELDAMAPARYAFRWSLMHIRMKRKAIEDERALCGLKRLARRGGTRAVLKLQSLEYERWLNWEFFSGSAIMDALKAVEDIAPQAQLLDAGLCPRLLGSVGRALRHKIKELTPSELSQLARLLIIVGRPWPENLVEVLEAATVASLADFKARELLISVEALVKLGCVSQPLVSSIAQRLVDVSGLEECTVAQLAGCAWALGVLGADEDVSDQPWSMPGAVKARVNVAAALQPVTATLHGRLSEATSSDLAKIAGSCCRLARVEPRPFLQSLAAEVARKAHIMALPHLVECGWSFAGLGMSSTLLQQALQGAAQQDIGQLNDAMLAKFAWTVGCWALRTANLVDPIWSVLRGRAEHLSGDDLLAAVWATVRLCLHDDALMSTAALRATHVGPFDRVRATMMAQCFVEYENQWQSGLEAGRIAYCKQAALHRQPEDRKRQAVRGVLP